MASILFIGGTGQISLPCVFEALDAGHQVSVLNRGKTDAGLPTGVSVIVGDMDDAATYADLGDRNFDVVCQFRCYTPEQMKKDIATFSGKTGQYVFISSASAYQKPARHYIITEETPLENPYWEYSRKKADCEALLRGQTGLPWTVVRPSHTVRTGLPLPMGDGDAVARRLLRGAPVIVHGDGTSLWTLTRCADFAVPFVRLLGNPKAAGEAFQITNDRAFTWNEITNAIAAGLGVEATLVHVPTETLVRYNPEWEGPLMGDKSWSVLFDNSKVKRVAGDFACAQDLPTILEELDRQLQEAQRHRRPVAACARPADGPHLQGAGGARRLTAANSEAALSRPYGRSWPKSGPRRSSRAARASSAAESGGWSRGCAVRWRCHMRRQPVAKGVAEGKAELAIDARDLADRIGGEVLQAQLGNVARRDQFAVGKVPVHGRQVFRRRSCPAGGRGRSAGRGGRCPAGP